MRSASLRHNRARSRSGRAQAFFRAALHAGIRLHAQILQESLDLTGHASVDLESSFPAGKVSVLTAASPQALLLEPPRGLCSLRARMLDHFADCSFRACRRGTPTRRVPPSAPSGIQYQTISNCERTTAANAMHA